MTRKAMGLALAAAMLLAAGPRLSAQEQPSFRMWAAQTGPDQLALAWAEVPGAVEYRIHIGDPAAAATPAARRPISVLSGSARGGFLPLRRVTGALFLVAVGSDGRPILKLPFNEVTPVRGVRPVEAPASVTATVSGSEEVTLSWDAVPGATGYMIGRAVRPEGLRMLCALCSSAPSYVDRDVTPGAEHSYTVAAIYPGGISQRTRSNAVTPGVVAAAGPGESAGGPARTPLPSLPAGQPQTPTSPYTPPGQPAGTTPTYTPPGQPAGTTPTYTPPGQPAGTTPTYTPPGHPAGTTPTYTPPGQPAGTTPTYTPPGQPAGTTPTYTPPTGPQPPTTAPTTADTANVVATIAAQIQSITSGVLQLMSNRFAAQTTGTHAATPIGVPVSDTVAAIADLVSQARSLAGNVVGGIQTSTQSAATIAGQIQAITNGVLQLMNGRFAPRTLQIVTSAGTPVSDTVSAIAAMMGEARSLAQRIASLFPQPQLASQTTATHAATPVYTSPCRLDYQRADNMWAAYGRPDGPLGVETITLQSGQTKVFVTDWKYEKQRNDGSNYYGSHLRIATNPGQRPVKVQVRSAFTVAKELLGAIKGANGNYYLPIDPGQTKQFQADLVEVSCTN